MVDSCTTFELWCNSCSVLLFFIVCAYQSKSKSTRPQNSSEELRNMTQFQSKTTGGACNYANKLHRAPVLNLYSACSRCCMQCAMASESNSFCRLRQCLVHFCNKYENGQSCDEQTKRAFEERRTNAASDRQRMMASAVKNSVLTTHAPLRNCLLRCSACT